MTDYPQNASEQIQTVEENYNVEAKTLENEKYDLKSTLVDDMKVIRGNSREKIVFRNNVKAIRTLQFIEKEKRAACDEASILEESPPGQF